MRGKVCCLRGLGIQGPGAVEDNPGKKELIDVSFTRVVQKVRRPT